MLCIMSDYFRGIAHKDVIIWPYVLVLYRLIQTKLLQLEETSAVEVKAEITASLSFQAYQ